MAKNVYKIPTSIKRSFLDHEIALRAGGFQIPATPVKVIMFWVISIFVIFWLLSATFLKSADLWILALLVVWWFVATGFFGTYSKAKEMKWQQLTSLVAYNGRANRVVNTRKSTDPSAFYQIAPVESIDRTGYITWADGTVGQVYLVVGSASVLVFAQDKVAILDRVDAFWRKVDTSAEYVFVTTKEPQRVYRQLAALERRNCALEVRDPELFELMEEQYDILKDYVGGSFNSIHQYLLVKAENQEALKRAHTVIMAEAEESSLMIRQLTMLDADEAAETLKTVYAAAA